MTDPNLPPVTPPSGQQPPAPEQPPAAPAYQEQPAAAPQPYGQAPYGQAPYGQQPYGAPTEKYNVLAIVSLVTGILFVSLAAIITGHIALSQISKTQEKGRGLAIAGLVLGYAGILLGILAGILFAVGLFALVANNPEMLTSTPVPVG